MADELTNTEGTNEQYRNLNQNGPLVRDQYMQFVANNTDNINQMYDASKQSQLTNLEMAYNQNLSDAEANREKMTKQYNTAANDLAVQYERNRMNNNLQAQLNGLNVGVGSQMNLALGSQYNRDFGNLRASQAAQGAELDRQIANINMTYRDEVNKAIADNDFARAAALVDEANNQIGQLRDAYQMQYNEDATAAALLAAGGDYGAYGQMFGLSDDQMNALHMQWAVANPEAAVYSGVITPEQYTQITGKTARGFGGGGTGGGSRGRGIKGTYYDSKVLGSSVVDAARTGDPAKVEKAYNDYVAKYGTPSKDTQKAWARKGLTIG